MEFFYFILIGICAGWLAGQITKSTGAGVLGDLVIGVIGAIVGGWVFGILGLASTSLIGSLIMATDRGCGAVDSGPALGIAKTK